MIMFFYVLKLKFKCIKIKKMQIILDKTIKSELLRRKMMPTARQLADILVKLLGIKKRKKNKIIKYDCHDQSYEFDDYMTFKTVAELNDYVTSYLDITVHFSLNAEYYCNIIIDAIYNSLEFYCYYDYEYELFDVFVRKNFNTNSLLLIKALEFYHIEKSDYIKDAEKLTADDFKEWVNGRYKPVDTVKFNKWAIKTLSRK